jgi:hypothetical protein
VADVGTRSEITLLRLGQPAATRKKPKLRAQLGTKFQHPADRFAIKLLYFQGFLRADGETRTPDPFITSGPSAAQLPEFCLVQCCSMQFTRDRIAEFGTKFGTKLERWPPSGA